MARNINVEEAASWSKEELQTNVEYLEIRCRFPELDRISEILGSKATKAEPDSVPEVEEDEVEEEVVEAPKPRTKPRTRKKEIAE